MQLSALSAKQRRLASWQHFLDEANIADKDLHARTQKVLAQFNAQIARCWNAKKIEPQDEFQILDLERQLEELNEQARLEVGTNTPLKKEER